MPNATPTLRSKWWQPVSWLIAMVGCIVASVVLSILSRDIAALVPAAFGVGVLLGRRSGWLDR